MKASEQSGEGAGAVDAALMPPTYTQRVSIGAASFDTPAVVRRFHEARRSEDLVVLQGFHALKHALRFGASVEVVACSDTAELARLGEGLAPDLVERMQALAVVLPVEAFKRLGPYVPHTGVVSIARRVATDPLAVLAAEGQAPLVLLEDPRHFGNLGAVIRVAAAAEVAGVLTTGRQDPWDPVAVRGSAGLHFALPVARLADPRPTGRCWRWTPRRGAAPQGGTSAGAAGVRNRARRPQRAAARSGRRASAPADA